jgi:hypothetical protein
MTLFSLVTVYLIGGFGIFYVLHSTLQPWYVTMLVAIAWTALLLWLFLANRPSEGLLLHGPHCSCGYSLPIDRPKTGDW